MLINEVLMIIIKKSKHDLNFNYDVTGDCEDINECELGYCGGSEQCVNTDGSFDCICSAGMTKVTNITS